MVKMRFCWALLLLSLATLSAVSADVSSIISRDLFNQMLKYRNDPRCPSQGFYTYDAFITAANSFKAFGTTGDAATQKRELAAFLGQTSHETTGGWPSAPDGPYAWGYCLVREREPETGNFCNSQDWPCPAGRKYYGRGPIQLTHNYNYGMAGKAIGADLINNPDLVATNPVISFKTAMWFWMTPQGNKPSAHSVIVGQWKPSAADNAAGRVPGYGVITNIINAAASVAKARMIRWRIGSGFTRGTVTCSVLAMEATWIATTKSILLDYDALWSWLRRPEQCTAKEYSDINKDNEACLYLAN